MNGRSQIIILIWGLAFLLTYGLSFWYFMHMLPPPDANLPAEDIAKFYQTHSFDIRVGAMITSWTSAFALPIAVVAGIQIRRLEKGLPVWSTLAIAGGVMMSMFLVFPPILWGVAAYTPDRAPEATALIHELSLLTLTTTDQYFIFQMVGIGFISLTTNDPDTAFPRWLGFFTLWAAVAFEVGAIAFLPKAGPFTWNGIVVFWMPFVVYGNWLIIMTLTMIFRIRRQIRNGTVERIHKT